MIQKLVVIGLLFAGLLSNGAPVSAQDQFYRGKVVRVIVGFPPGGGYDTYARLIARHMGKYVAGNPTIVVDNMSGAGSMISANHIFRVAKPDGLTVGHFIGGLFLQQILGKPGIEFDARKFEYIGAPAQDNFIMGLHKNTGFTSLQQWIAAKTVVKFGGAGFGAGTDDLDRGGARRHGSADPTGRWLQRHGGHPPGLQQRRDPRHHQLLAVDPVHLAQRAR